MSVSRQTVVFLCAILVIGVLGSIAVAGVTGTIHNTQFSDYEGDSRDYNDIALSVIDRGSLLNENGNYYGWPRRAVGYPLFLALVYSVWRSPVAAWAAHELVFLLSILLMWRIATFFLSRGWAFITALLFSIAWFVSTFVIGIGSDLLGMFLALMSIWALLEWLYRLKFKEHFSYWLILITGIALGSSALVRPIMLYFVIPAAVFILYASSFRWKSVALFLFVFGMVVTPLMLWSYKTFGTPQLASSGYVLTIRSRDVLLSREDMLASFTAAVFGDVFTDYFFPGFIQDPYPYPQMNDVIRQRTTMKEEGVGEKKIDSFFYSESIGHIVSQPVKFVFTGLFNLIRLNNPPNHKGVLMFHFLAESNLSFSMRIFANIIVRLIWLSFIYAVVWGAYFVFRNMAGLRLFWIIIVLFVLYKNFIHALFTHAEFRFLLSVIPFYILFFTVALKSFVDRRFAVTIKR